MFGSGSLSQAAKRRSARLSVQSQGDSSAAAASLTQRDTDMSPSLRPSFERTTTAILSTPHDAVLAELHGQRPAMVSQAGYTGQSDAPERPKLHSLQNANNSSAALLRSAASSPVSENVFDPFTGAAVGIMSPPPAERDSTDREQPDPAFEQTKDELWSHLTRIRNLQNEIAGMHSQMEGVGASDSTKHKRAAPSAAGVRTDTIGAGEWEERVPQQHKKHARDAEFANLAEVFEGRRAAIDGIMGKLDDLSKAVTTFHALPTPVFDFSISRGGTKDPMLLPPDLSSSTSPQTAAQTASTSPILPQITVDVHSRHSEVPEMELHDSPTSITGEHPHQVIP